jgi:hypothetical protein
MTVIFADNFETGVVWTKEMKTSGEAIAIVSIPEGKAAQFSTDGLLTGTETGEMCYLQQDFIQTYNELFLRAYVFYKDLPSVSAESIGLSIRNREGSGGAVAYVQVGMPSPHLLLVYDDAVSKKSIDTGVSIIANQWYCIELHAVIGAGTGLVQLFVDDVKIAEALNIDNSTVGPAQIIQIGERWFTGQVPHMSLVDKVVVATEYVGPISPVVFEDDFETGLSKWTTQVKTVGEAITVTIEVAHGVGAASFTTDGVETGEMSYLQKDLANPYADLYLRAYVLYKDLPPIGKQSIPLYVRTTVNASLVGCQVGGVASDALYLRYGDTHALDNIVDTGFRIVVNRWYCIELHVTVGAGNGAVELFVDGVKVGSATNIDNSTGRGPAKIIIVGERWFTGQVPHVILIDDVVAATEYIGPITPTNPKVTVISSPELGVPVYIDGSFIGNTPIIVSIPSGTHTVRVESEVTR